MDSNDIAAVAFVVNVFRLCHTRAIYDDCQRPWLSPDAYTIGSAWSANGQSELTKA
jgi:tryptophan-rich sensory protein